MGEELLVVGQSHLLLLITLLNRRRVELGTWRFVNLGFGGSVKSIWPNAMKLEADARRTGPSVGGGGVTFDLPSSASFAGSHNYIRPSVSKSCLVS